MPDRPALDSDTLAGDGNGLDAIRRSSNVWAQGSFRGRAASVSESPGMPVSELAQYVKSWNPYEASLGLAAINSVLNSPEQVAKLYGRPLSTQGQVSAFVHYAEMVRGKKVAVVGRFPDLNVLTDVCRLTVLERNPGDG